MLDRSNNTFWIFASYLPLLVWVPIPLGSNRFWSWALLAVWVFTLALWWLAIYIRGKSSIPTILQHAWPMLLCGLLWLGYAWFQLVPLPIEILRQFSPEAAHWHLAAAAPDTVAAAPLSLDRYATLEAACKSTAYITFFALNLILLQGRDRIRVAAYTLIASGVFQAFYGTLIRFQNMDQIATGTFPNRNHYAAYLVICLSVGIGVLIANLSGTTNRSWRHSFRNLTEWMISPKMALRLALLVMVIALVLTRSRMGNISFFVSLLVAGAISWFLSKHATKSMVVLFVSLIAIDAIIVGSLFGTQRVVERIARTSPIAEDRGEVAGWTINMWRDFPVFGSGLGSFPVVYPRYAGDKAWWTYTHAHNDYLELGAETGLIGVTLVGLMALMAFAVALRAQYLRRDPLMRGLSFAAIMSIVALLLHSLVDYSLQIPGNALTFTLLLAFAWISRYHEGAEA